MGVLARVFIVSIVFAIAVLLTSTAMVVDAIESTNNYVVVISITGTIDYGVVELVKEGIERAEAVDGVLVITLDTPGGYLDAAEEIVSLIRESRVPVVGFVVRKGAWSAGTLILLATHVAAMEPGTIIGSMQPVMYNPATGEYQPINQSKITEPVRKYAEVLAKARGRNVSVATAFVLYNLNLEATEALEYGVIEFVAYNVVELVNKINGYRVRLDNGVEVVINTENAHIDYYHGSLRAQAIHFLSDPLINGLFATIGILILLFSIISGHYVITPIGIGLLLLSLVGTGFSPNTASLALILVGAIALAIELFVTPGFGVLGYTGIILIALGMILMPLYSPGWLISGEYQKMMFWTAVSIAVVMGVFTSIIVYKALKARRKPPVLKTDMGGKIGRVIEEIKPGKEGFVFINGEYWRARCSEEVGVGEKVVVVGKDGPVLIVKKAIVESSSQSDRESS